MSVKNAQRLRNALLLAGFLVMLLGYYAVWIGYLGIAIAVSSLIPHFLFNKCPHCGRQLGRNEGDFCQFCGNNLKKG